MKKYVLSLVVFLILPSVSIIDIGVENINVEIGVYIIQTP